MTTIKKIHNASLEQKILNELREIKKAAEESNREVYLKNIEPFQTVDSPYFPDRQFSNPLAVQDNPEEVEWKKVATYEEQRNSYYNSDTSHTQEDIVIINNKKLNII